MVIMWASLSRSLPREQLDPTLMTSPATTHLWSRTNEWPLPFKAIFIFLPNLDKVKFVAQSNTALGWLDTSQTRGTHVEIQGRTSAVVRFSPDPPGWEEANFVFARSLVSNEDLLPVAQPTKSQPAGRVNLF